MEAYVPPTYLRELRRARRRHGLRVAGRLMASLTGLACFVLLALAGIGFVSA